MLHKGQTLFSHQTEVDKAKLSQMPQPTVRDGKFLLFVFFRAEELLGSAATICILELYFVVVGRYARWTKPVCLCLCEKLLWWFECVVCH